MVDFTEIKLLHLTEVLNRCYQMSRIIFHCSTNEVLYCPIFTLKYWGTCWGELMMLGQMAFSSSCAELSGTEA